MQINPVQLQNKNKLINDYRAHHKKIMAYFDYEPTHFYKERIDDLKKRTFKRDQLTAALLHMNKQWDAPANTLKNIEKLNEKNSLVVIGGQQAGLLTGPMYTVNKVVSIIQLAKQQQEKLQTPVVPVFWIAGEDHDFDEINHVFMPKNNRMIKLTHPQAVLEKRSISHIKIDQKATEKWINQLFLELDETMYTNSLHTTLMSCLSVSETYVDFFARLIFKLFEDDGVILIDSAHPDIRKIESDYFIEIINKQTPIAKEVYRSVQTLKQKGYELTLEVSASDAHIFYHDEFNERILLQRTDDGAWIGKQNEVELTTNELITIAKNSPERLSNNVITRPLMQELLFPTLAFVGGDGEISYWAALKPMFAEFGLKVPPVIPRLSFTLINQKVTKALKKRVILPEEAINQGVEQLKINWLSTQNNPPISQMIEEVKNQLTHVHQPIRDVAHHIRSDIGQIADRNLDHIHHHLDHLERRMIQGLKEKYVVELSEYELIKNTLYPEGVLQERVWNPLPFINEHGINFVQQLTNESCSFSHNHYLVYI